MEAYILGLYNNKIRIYDRTPGAKIKLYDYDYESVLKAFLSNKIQFSGYDAEIYEDINGNSLATKRIFDEYILSDKPDLSKMSVKRFKEAVYVYDIVQTDTLSYNFLGVKPYNGEEVVISTDDITGIGSLTDYSANIKRNSKKLYNIILNNWQPSSIFMNDYLLLKDGNYYCITPLGISHPIRVAKPKTPEADKLFCSKLKMIASNNEVLSDIAENCELGCRKWYSIYNKMQHKYSIPQSYNIKKPQDKKAIKFSSIPTLQDLEDVFDTRVAYNRLMVELSNSNKSKLDNPIYTSRIFNFLLFYGYPLNLTKEHYFKLLNTKKCRLATFKYNDGINKIILLAFDGIPELKDIYIASLIMNNDIIHDCVIKSKKVLIKDINNLFITPNKNFENKYNILDIYSPGYTKIDSEVIKTTRYFNIPIKLQSLIEVVEYLTFQSIRVEHNRVQFKIKSSYIDDTIIVFRRSGSIIEVVNEVSKTGYSGLSKEMNKIIQKYLFYNKEETSRVRDIIDTNINID